MKPLASANCRAGGGSAVLTCSHVALLTKVIGMALVAEAVSNTEGMRLSAFSLWRPRLLHAFGLPW